MTTTDTSPSPTRATARRSWRRFTLHYLEMVAAMFIGMGVLALARAALGLHVSSATHLEFSYLLMALDMSIGMAVVMRWRRHPWAHTLEMCAVMFLPVVLFPLVWAGVLSTTGFMVIAHVAMFPLMLAVMLRHRSTCAATPEH